MKEPSSARDNPQFSIFRFTSDWRMLSGASFRQPIIWLGNTKQKQARIGHFRVAFRLCFKTSPHAKLFLWKWVWFPWKWTCRWKKVSYQRFRTKTVLTQRNKLIQNWPNLFVTLPSTGSSVRYVLLVLLILWRFSVKTALLCSSSDLYDTAFYFLFSYGLCDEGVERMNLRNGYLKQHTLMKCFLQNIEQ